MKKILSLALTVLFVFTSFSFTAIAEGDVETQLKTELGTAPTDGKLDLIIDAPEYYTAGDDITVTVFVRNIAAENGLHVVGFTLYYDNDVLLLTNDLDEEDENALVCIKTLPDGWENFSIVENDYNPDAAEGTVVNPINDGVINASAFTAKSSKKAAITADDALVFEFTFKALTDAKGDAGIVIPHAEAEGAYNGDMGEIIYPAVGGYSIIHEAAEVKGYPATCTEDGLTDGLKCADCGKILVEQKPIPKKGHTDGEWVVTLDPTCTEAGKKELHCATCNDVIDTADIDKLGHDDGEWTTTLEPTLDTTGTAERRCTECNELLETKTLPALFMLGDVNGNGEIEKYDYIAVKRAVMHTLTLDDNQTRAANVNLKDGVEKYDYILIKRHVMKTYVIEG